MAIPGTHTCTRIHTRSHTHTATHRRAHNAKLIFNQLKRNRREKRSKWICNTNCVYVRVCVCVCAWDDLKPTSVFRYPNLLTYAKLLCSKSFTYNYIEVFLQCKFIFPNGYRIVYGNSLSWGCDDFVYCSIARASPSECETERKRIELHLFRWLWLLLNLSLNSFFVFIWFKIVCRE